MNDIDMSAIYRDDATNAEIVVAYQRLIDTGDAWRMDGSTGRAAMSLIETGDCVLGEVAHNDYWGNRVPSRTDVKAGTKGSLKYQKKMLAARKREARQHA